jgi:hypothetical protein
MNFEGREAELNTIEKHLIPDSTDYMNERRAVVLCGMGGVGKSQIASQYAFTHRQHYDAIFGSRALPTMPSKIVLQRLRKYSISSHSSLGCLFILTSDGC